MNLVISHLMNSGLMVLAGLFLLLNWNSPQVFADPLPGGSQDPTLILKYQTSLVIPPVMPLVGKIKVGGRRNIDYYEIAVKQFQQQIMPPGMPMTTVWGYGRASDPVPGPGVTSTFNYPSFTIETRWKKPIAVRWVNGLVDQDNNYLPHLLPIDQTLHWANPPGGVLGRDMEGTDPAPYTGPVPMVVHVHGAHTGAESDGFTEAWYLPDAGNIPAGYATTGTYYDIFKNLSPLGTNWSAGSAVFSYPNNQRPGTLWYHDHSLGITRANVYAGPAGFYLIRGGPDDAVLDSGTGVAGRLPRPAPALGDPPGMTYHEIPIVIQDRSFNSDGSLFYPDNRAFFEGLDPSQLQIPFIPDMACDDLMSDVSPIWNPEFFGNTMVANGRTWPQLDVEQRRYRFRLLNGCNARTLILQLDNGLPFWQIGTEGGFLPAPVQLNQLLMAPAERADVIIDFTNVPVGTDIILQNFGPDFPFGGGVPGVDFPPADASTTGQVMRFHVVARIGRDNSTPVNRLVLPTITPLGPVTNTRQVSLNELDSATVHFSVDEFGNLVLDCADEELFEPITARLGTVNPDGNGNPLKWDDAITEPPAFNATEVWEIHNFTEDAHPIHIHEIMFQVIDRQPFGGAARPPEAWETGFKDTVIAYPGEITRVKAKFDVAGLFVWHCHILEHEDNEMMRPLCVGGNCP